jgi:heterokaryon incompatibility protein Het-C
MLLVLEISPLLQKLKVQTGVMGKRPIIPIPSGQCFNDLSSDIEDTLLQLFITRIGGGRKFSKMDVKRVYFGNWLRDYSQAVDVS